MSAAKHTPGPWEALRNGNIVACCNDSRPLLDITVGMAFASPEMGRAQFEVQAANGQLMAAAPNMLAALIVAREFVSSERSVFVDTAIGFQGAIEPDDAAELAYIDAALIQIDAAIHAAIGSAA